MTSAFDKRIVRVGIQIENDFLTFEDADIRIQGQKFFSPSMNICNVKISNLTRSQTHEILTRATPNIFTNNPNAAPVFVTVDVGRESYGTFRLFEGQCYASTATLPPDIGIILRSLTQSFATGIIASITQPGLADIRTIAQDIADKNGLILDFKAEPRQIANFSHTGAVSKLINKLQLIGNVRACVNNKTLIVRDKNGFTKDPGFTLSQETGMIGIPQATESGALAQMLINPAIDIGDKIRINSKINPSVNSDEYNISQMTFDIANRDQPFLYTLLCTSLGYVTGTS